VSVAFVIDKYPPFIGGSEYQARLLARLIATRLGPSHVFTAQSDACSDAPALILHRLGASRGRPRHPLNFAAAFAELLTRGGRYAIVHGYALSGLTCGAVLGAALRGRPALVKICAAGPEGDVAKVRRHALGRWLWPMIRRSCAFVVPSPGVVSELLTHGVPPRAITVIPNALRLGAPEPPTPASKASARAALELPDRATVLFVGRLSPEKGPDLLMRAWELIAPACDATLVVVGAGPDGSRLAHWARRSVAADRIHVVGARPDVDPFYRAADVLVVPSQTETFSNVMAEAMAHGLAVVTTPVGLAGHWLHDGRNGVVVRADDEREMAAAVVRLVRHPAAGEGLGRAAREDALAAFSASAIVERYLELYGRLMAGASRPEAA